MQDVHLMIQWHSQLLSFATGQNSNQTIEMEKSIKSIIKHYFYSPT
nr:MAG TPA: hypothetical protein [Caudoviricetes sp.]